MHIGWWWCFQTGCLVLKSNRQCLWPRIGRFPDRKSESQRRVNPYWANPYLVPYTKTMSSSGHLYNVHLMDSVPSSWKKVPVHPIAIVHPPNFWTIFRVIPAAGWSFQLFVQSCNSNQPSTKPHKNGQRCSFQKIFYKTNTSAELGLAIK